LRGAVRRIQPWSPFLVFLGTALSLWWAFGNRLILGTNDEGIYLTIGERILHGQRLYVDFFGYLSPGSFWLQALAMRLLGVTLAAGRMVVILDVALECALIYWLVSRYASRACAALTWIMYLAFQTADPSMLTAQHRWDSGALALGAIAICVAAQGAGRERWLAASGLLMACAALATPSVALVALTTLGWLAWPGAWPGDRRRRAAWYLVGLASGATAAGIALWLDGILPAFVRQMQWLARNYTAVNVMHYGSIIGGYKALLAGGGGLELAVRACVVICVALPAVLPVVALAGGVVLWRRERSGIFIYLTACVVALVVSTHPRSDVAHLEYVAALSYALAAIVIYRMLRPRPRFWIVMFLGVWGAVFAWQSWRAGEGRVLETPVGEVRASVAEAPEVTQLLAQVRPHAALFVYPYKPLLYFLTQGENPTRYCYLQPGLTTGADADVALSELKAHPPEWVLYMDLTQAEFERVFPSGKAFDAHFPALENWIKANYRSRGGRPVSGYALLHRAT